MFYQLTNPSMFNMRFFLQVLATVIVIVLSSGPSQALTSSVSCPGTSFSLNTSIAVDTSSATCAVGTSTPDPVSGYKIFLGYRVSGTTITQTLVSFQMFDGGSVVPPNSTAIGCSGSPATTVLGSSFLSLYPGGAQSINCSVNYTDIAGRVVSQSLSFDRPADGLIPSTLSASTAFVSVSPEIAISRVPSSISGPFTATFAFDEAVTGFDLSDILIGNGVASNFAGGGAVYTATITPITAGTVTIDVPAGAAQNSASQNSIAAPQVSTSFDSSIPSVVLSGLTSPVTTTQTVTARFSEDVVGFEASDVNLMNIALSGFTQIDARTYTFSLSPTGGAQVSVNIPAGAAQDLAGNLTTASNTLAATNPVVEDTSRLIGEFLYNRANSLIASQPRLTRFLTAGTGHFNATVTRELQSVDLATNPDFPIWFELTGSRSESGSTESHYVLGTIGAHKRISSNFLVGAMLQVDDARDQNSASEVDGSGWLFGPYVVARHAAQPLYFEGRLLYGRTSNEISPFGTYTDEFDTERWLAQVRVTGEIKGPGISYLPHFDVSQLSERQDSYTDSLDNLIPKQSIDLTNVEFGIDVSVPLNASRGKSELTAGVTGIWSKVSSDSSVIDVTTEFEGGRARLDLGFNHNNRNGTTFVVGGYYDGIGANDYEAYGGNLRLEIRF
ncbi:Ig-like domain-containing protein [Aliiroseovarius sp. 2305UL8-7]|uniref:Ig-like domain-containing protein n=1 Tax=Aliiroseovarius conchicola TaxID=3121637 RepID=UPI003528D608